MRSLRRLVVLVLGGAFLLGVWSAHRPPTAKPAPPDGPAFGTAAVARSHDGRPMARLMSIQTSRQRGFDRVEFVFDRAPPGWRVAYAPSIQDGAGGRVPVAGRALLALAFQPAQAHAPGGGPSFGPPSRTPGYDALRQVRLAGDVEGRVRFGLGLGARAGFRVLEAGTPSRVIVDVQAP